MAQILNQALAQQQAAAAPAPWVNPYQAQLEAQQAAMNAPQAPAYSPEQVAQRQAANQRAQRWGILGLMMGDEGQAKAGGTVLQQALQASAPRITDRGTFDPTTGQMVVNPEYARERGETRTQRLQDLAAQAQASHESREDTQAFQQSQLREQIAGRKEQAALQREALGLQKQQVADQKANTQALHLNEQWNKLNKDDLERKTQFQNLGVTPDTPAGDISFIYSWMKAQDPGSTVRESEFSLAQHATAFKGAQNYVNQILTGKRLTPEMRVEMMATAKANADAADARIADKNKYFIGAANKLGLDPSLIIPEYGGYTAAQQAAASNPAAAATPTPDRRAGKDRRAPNTNAVATNVQALPPGLTPDLIAAELAKRQPAAQPQQPSW